VFVGQSWPTNAISARAAMAQANAPKWSSPRGAEAEGTEMKTDFAKQGEAPRDWYVVDAEGQVLGRLASQIAYVLRGKNKPTFTPHMDTGDFVVIINAEKVRVSGNKPTQKIYRRHSGRPGGMTSDGFVLPLLSLVVFASGSVTHTTSSFKIGTSSS
jgi:hypothetical protein